jgi:hypothetical protein
MIWKIRDLTDSSLDDSTDESSSSEYIGNQTTLLLSETMYPHGIFNNIIIHDVEVNNSEKIIPMQIIKTTKKTYFQLFCKKYRKDYKKLIPSYRKNRNTFIISLRQAWHLYATNHIYVAPKLINEK